jgi:hypothetical protein
MSTLTDETEKELRAALDERERVYDDAYEAMRTADAKVINIVIEQIRSHGAVATVKWLKSRKSCIAHLASYGVISLFDDVLCIFGRPRKGSIARLLWDTADQIRKEQRQ